MFALLVACTSSSPAPAPRVEVPAPDTGDDTAAVDPLAAHLARHEGAWTGTADPTPVGAFPFGWTFAWEGDDTLSAVADNGYGFSISWTYTRTPAGTWELTETGSMPGGFEQSYVLTPSAIEGDTVTWVYPDDPDYLTATVEAGEGSLRIVAETHGETHAVVTLARPE